MSKQQQQQQQPDHTKVDRDVDYYAVIGCPPTATKSEISKAYRLKGNVNII
jgi:coenzyme F420-reducing hydrogenase gamma subunit